MQERTLSVWEGNRKNFPAAASRLTGIGLGVRARLDGAGDLLGRAEFLSAIGADRTPGHRRHGEPPPVARIPLKIAQKRSCLERRL